MKVASEPEPKETAVVDTPTLIDVANDSETLLDQTSIFKISSRHWLERFCSEFELNVDGIDTSEKQDTQAQKHTSPETSQTKRVSFGRGVRQSNSMPAVATRKDEPAPMELELPGGVELQQRPNFESDVPIQKTTINNARSHHNVACKYIQSTSSSAGSVFHHKPTENGVDGATRKRKLLLHVS